MEFIKGMLEQYGYIVLFVALMLELIAFPLPGEVLMSFCGFLVFQGKLNWTLSILIAWIGTSIGISLSYFIGLRLGTPFFHKYGKYVHMDGDKLEKTSRWFEKYGVRTLAIAYFIPGLRHVTGYLSGTTRIPYPKFATYSYLGALIWTGTFISLGKVLGPKWELLHGTIKKYFIIGSLILVVIIALILIYKTYKDIIINNLLKTLNGLVYRYNSLGKAKALITCTLITLASFLILVIGLTQDFLNNEFQQFDEIVSLLMILIFSDSWESLMRVFQWFASYKVMIPLIALASLYIIYNSKHKRHELLFYTIAIFSGEILDEVLRRLFQRSGPNGIILNTFPSEYALVSLVVYGFTTFLIIRYLKSKLLKSAIIFLTIGILFSIGLSKLYFGLQYPSDIVAGYAFGGVCLSVNIILFELYGLQLQKPLSN